MRQRVAAAGNRQRACTEVEGQLSGGPGNARKINRVVAFAGQFNNLVRTPAVIQHIGIVALATHQPVIAGTAIQRVVAVIAGDGVDPRAALDDFDVTYAAGSSGLPGRQINGHIAGVGAVIERVAQPVRTTIERAVKVRRAEQGEDVVIRAAGKRFEGREGQCICGDVLQVACLQVEGRRRVHAHQTVGDAAADERADIGEAAVQTGFVAIEAHGAAQTGQHNIASGGEATKVQGVGTALPVHAARKDQAIRQGKGVRLRAADQVFDAGQGESVGAGVLHVGRLQVEG